MSLEEAVDGHEVPRRSCKMREHVTSSRTPIDTVLGKAPHMKATWAQHKPKDSPWKKNRRA